MPSGVRNTTPCACGCGQVIKRVAEPYLPGHLTHEHRFWAKVVKTDTCWLWTGATNTSKTKPSAGCGHGVVLGMMATHYVLKITGNIDVPDGLEVAHTCDVPACVNPDHLQIVTHAENMQQMWDRERRSRVGSRGERNGGSKLTADSVRLIRILAAKGIAFEDLAEDFEVTTWTIQWVVKRKTWKHVA